MTEHPNATDYRNRGERDAAYWRDLWVRYLSDDLAQIDAAYDEAVAELARINAETLR